MNPYIYADLARIRQEDLLREAEDNRLAACTEPSLLAGVVTGLAGERVRSLHAVPALATVIVAVVGLRTLLEAIAR